MIRLLVCLCFASVMVPCVAQEAGTRRTIEVGKNPESVCRGWDDRLFVTLINGEEPGDGEIVVVDGDKVSPFAKGLNAPKGLVFVGDVLVTADEKTLWKVDKTGTVTKLVDVANFPKPIEFLNDVAASRDGKSVFVAEMSTPTPMFDPSGERKLFDLNSTQAAELPKKGCVYRVTLDGQISEAMPSGTDSLRFPNGLAVGGRRDAAERLYAADFFTDNVVSYENGAYEVIATGPRGLDGLTVTRNAIYASSWTQGVVWKIDRETKQQTVLIEGMKSSADFYFDRRNNQLIVPDMIAGTLTMLPLPDANNR